jgi:site-specific DNA recombinase
MREQELSDRMAEVLKDIYVPETVAETIVASLSSDSARADAERQKRMEATQQRIAALRTRMDQVYEDKLDGKIDDEFWTRKMNEWREQERRLEAELSRLKVEVTTDSVLTAKYILELANQAHSLYLTRNHAERAQLGGFELRYGWRKSLARHRKPYDLISERAKNQEWSGR